MKRMILIVWFFLAVCSWGHAEKRTNLSVSVRLNMGRESAATPFFWNSMCYAVHVVDGLEKIIPGSAMPQSCKIEFVVNELSNRHHTPCVEIHAVKFQPPLLEEIVIHHVDLGRPNLDLKKEAAAGLDEVVKFLGLKPKEKESSPQRVNLIRLIRIF